MSTIDVHEGRSTLGRLPDRVEAGDRVTITRAGKPVADLVPHARPRLAFGAAAGMLAYDDSFDEPLDVDRRDAADAPVGDARIGQRPR